MAKVVLVEACSHSPFLFLKPEQWNEVRAARPPAPRNPEMSEEDNLLQHARCMAAFETFCEANRGVSVHTRNHVAVDVGRNRDASMAEPLLDDLHILPRRQHERRMRVAKSMQPDPH